MDQRFLDAYNRELVYLRELGREFAQEYPKVASKIALDNIDQPDPHVERLVESFAFLTARLALRQEDDYAVFTRNLLDMIHPEYLEPMPSTGIVELVCNPQDTALAEGVLIPRGESLKAAYQKGARTHCEFRTCSDTTLWPLMISEAQFSGYVPEFPPGVLSRNQVAGSLKLTLEAGADKKLNELPIDSLRFFLASEYVVANRLYEVLLGRVVGVLVSYQDQNGGKVGPVWANGVAFAPAGFGAEESLLPFSSRTQGAHRLFREFFVLPQKFLFVTLEGLQAVLKRIPSSRCTFHFLLSRLQDDVLSNVDASHFRLNSVPVVNLFHRHCDRVFVTERQREFHILADRTRASDFEIIRVTRVSGIDSRYDREVTFQPFFQSPAAMSDDGAGAWYTIERRRRVLPQQERARNNRISYPGAEVFLSMVDHQSLPFSPSLRQIAVEAWCSNRDLPMLIKSGTLDADLVLPGQSVAKSARFLVRPTSPLPSLAEGVVSWRLVQMLSFNYLSLLDQEPEEAANMLRAMLKTLAPFQGGGISSQINAIRRITFRRIVRRVDAPGPLVYAQGIEARVFLDENLFEGAGGFLLGKLLDVLLSRMAALNSFVETVIESMQRGEIKRWPVRVGAKPLL